MSAPVRPLRALDGSAPPEPGCTACQASLLGQPVACDYHRRLYAQQQRAAASRAQKPVAQARRRAAEAAAIERRLDQLARERRQRRQRLSLSEADCWQQAGVSSVYAMGDAP